MSDIFISYRHSDSAPYAGRLFDDLNERLKNAEIFMDTESIKPGTDFREALGQKIQACRIVLVLIGPSWLETLNDRIAQHRTGGDAEDYVYLEIKAAIKQNKLIIPVLFSESRMPAPGQLPVSIKALAYRQGFQIFDNYWQIGVERLVNQINVDLEGGGSSVEFWEESHSRPFVILKSVGFLITLYVPTVLFLPFDPRLAILPSAFVLGGYFGARYAFSGLKAIMVALATAALTVLTISATMGLYEGYYVFKGNTDEALRLSMLVAQLCIAFWVGVRLMTHLIDPDSRSLKARRTPLGKMRRAHYAHDSKGTKPT